ncbi:MAG TPA: glycosyltransferase family 9 protein [Thermomicrobiales bacterium]|nr:glycosyltransferase family 9 protein [Thermomicrobiales bacterium]
MIDVNIPREPRRIAVLRALFLGDMLCATPALRALRQRFPAAEITLIGLPWAEDFARRLSSVDRFVHFPGYPGVPEVPDDPEQTARFIDEARAYRYDIAIQMHGDGKLSNSFIADLGAELSIGFRRVGDERLTIGIPYVADEPEPLRWLRLIAALGGRDMTTGLEFPTTPREDDRARRLLTGVRAGDGPLIGLHAGASTPLRRWPAERFAALADELVTRWDARIVLTGSEAERDLTSHIRRMAASPVLDLAGQTDIGTFAALIGQLDLLVTNDTGASHLAAATRTPSVIIFGTTLPLQWAPLDHDRHLVVDARNYAPLEVPQVEALAQLPVEPVLLACERHLDGASPGLAPHLGSGFAVAQS